MSWQKEGIEMKMYPYEKALEDELSVSHGIIIVLRAEVERLQHDSAQWCADSELIQKALGVERIIDCVPTINAIRAEIERQKKYYYLVADAIARESSSANDLASIARNTRIERDALRAENERLRTALEKYADESNWDDFSGERMYSDVWYPHENGYKIARAALAESDPK